MIAPPHPSTMEQLEIAGIRTIDQVIVMNTRLREIMREGVVIDNNIDGMEEQIAFLCQCLEADRESIIAIYFDEMGTIYSMIRALRQGLEQAKERIYLAKQYQGEIQVTLE